MTDITPAQIKGLFHHLVKCVGGIEPSATFLGVSPQRVSQLQLTTHDSMPTVMQIFTLERACGQSVVFATLAKLIAPNSISEPMKEAGDLMVAGAAAFDAVRSGADTRTRRQAAMKARAECDELIASIDREQADT
jgi:DNA-binding transcriptional regulator YdaS (Cro superfamily)